MKFPLEITISPASELIDEPELITKSLPAIKVIAPLFLAITAPATSIDGAATAISPLLDTPALVKTKGIEVTKLRLETADAVRLEIWLSALLRLNDPFFKPNKLLPPSTMPVIVIDPLPPKVESLFSIKLPDKVDGVDDELTIAPLPPTPSPDIAIALAKLKPLRFNVPPLDIDTNPAALLIAVADPSISVA